ncbi:hypothetical protein WJX73_010860 [Symbiochloris irregularis]|uniref:Uncharacterized protein n=1 Tax=Symbiochloris irregularis TaxID=706552 RepID=A0AAW1PEM2_9CHLO
MARRTLLAAVLASTFLPSACSAGGQKGTAADLLDAEDVEFALRVVSLQGSVPQEWPVHWSKVVKGRTRLKLERRGQLLEIYQDLPLKGRTGKAASKSAATADAITLGDAWLAPAIRDGLIQPIPDALSSSWWKALPPRWRSLVRRDNQGLPSADGDVWAAPYRWGCTLIAANNRLLQRQGATPIRDWSDLLQPALKGRIAFVDAPRELVGVALRTLGASMNASSQQLQRMGITQQRLSHQLNRLRAQIAFFSSQDHTHALLAGRVSVCVGSSGDLLPLSARSSNVSLVAPASGTALHADLWCCPAHAGESTQMLQAPSLLLPVWLDFTLQPHRSATARGLLNGGAPPRLLPEAAPQQAGMHDAADVLDLAAGGLPSRGVLARSEFLLPQDENTVEMQWDALHPLYERNRL